MLHLERQRNAYRLLCVLKELSEYQPFASGTFAMLPEGEGMRWVPYLAERLQLSEKEIKQLLHALEESLYIRTLAGYAGNIKLLEKSDKANKRVNLGGGYCGHDNDEPVFEMARRITIGKGTRYPSVIIKAVERIVQYYSRPNLIPSLKYCCPDEKSKTKSGNPRQQYAQRRYACVITLSALLKRMDIKTLQIVVSDKEGMFYHCKVSVLVNDTGLHPRRVERALHDIVDAGLVNVLGRPTSKDENGKFEAMPAIRALNESLFGVLGLEVALREERKKRKEIKIKQNKKQQKKQKAEENTQNRSGVHRMKIMFDASQQRQAKSQQKLFDEKQRQQQTKQNQFREEAHKKQYFAKLQELYEAYSGEKDTKELRRLARELTGYNGD